MKIQNISKAYGERIILNGVTAEFGTGLSFIIGDSGEGKSTLLNILGLLDSPDSGSLSYEKANVLTDEAAQCRANEIGFVFQESNLIDGLTVYDNIALAASMSDSPKTEDEIDSLLREFQIFPLKQTIVNTLSGGEKQRVAIVRALAKEATLLLADEPTGSLDTDNSELVFQYLKEAAKTRTVIVITHNKERAFTYGNRVYELQNGMLQLVKAEKLKGTQDSPKPNSQLPTQPVLSKVYLKKLTKNSIRQHKGKFVSMSLALAIVCVLLSSFFLAITGVSNQQQALNATYYNLDEVEIYPVDWASQDKDLMMSLFGGYFSDEEIKEIQSSGHFTEVVPFAKDNCWLPDSENPFSAKGILLDDFFEERIMSDQIEGTFPETENQIIIGEDLANQLYGGKAIGETFVLEDFFENEYSFTVSGINHEKNVDGEYWTYVPAERMMGQLRKAYSCVINIYDNNSTDLISAAFPVTRLSSGTVIYGKSQPVENEITVSLSNIREIYENQTGTRSSLTADNFASEAETDPILQELLAETYAIDGNDVYRVSIVGVHDGPEDEMLMSESFYETTNRIYPTVLECYTTDYDWLEELTHQPTLFGYSFYSAYGERFSTVQKSTTLLSMVFFLLLIIAAVTFFVVMNSFVKVSLSDHEKETGILKSLGARKKDLYHVLMADNFALGILSGIISAVLFLVFAVVLSVVTELHVGVLTCVAEVILLLLIPPVTTVALAHSKIKKKVQEKPVDSIR